MALIEAGTGTGKSWPIWCGGAVAIHHSQRVVISTNTINLQEQLLQRTSLWYSRRSFRTCAPTCQGWVTTCASCACGQRLGRGQAGAEDSLAQITEWASKTVEGSLSELGRKSALWTESPE